MFGLDNRTRRPIFVAVTKRTVSRLASGLVLLVVLLTQVGLDLLHTHQGWPDRHGVAVQADSDSNASCQVCALDAVVASEVPTDSFTTPEFSKPVFTVVLRSDILLSLAGLSHGRAPPIC